MKNSVPRITFIILTTILFLQSCTKEKTYELQFEKLGLFSFADLKTPEYISDCRLVIKSTVDIDTVEYRTKAHELLDIFEYDYKYTNNWNNSNCGILHILNIYDKSITPNDKIVYTIYDKNGLKCFELEYDDEEIKRVYAWEDGNSLIEFEGYLSLFSEWEYCFKGGVYKRYETKDGITYLKEEESTSGYSRDCDEYEYNHTIYYPSGEKYYEYKSLLKLDPEGFSEYDEPFERVNYEENYYKKDGSIMSVVDRFLEEMDNYVIFKNTNESYWSDNNFHIALLPHYNSNKRGFGVVFYSNKQFTSIQKRICFSYEIEENTIECSDFFAYEFGRIPEGIHSAKCYLDLYEDNGEIYLKGMKSQYNNMHMLYNITMRKIEHKYDKGLHDALRKNIY